jgi:hypothetical protein
MIAFKTSTLFTVIAIIFHLTPPILNLIQQIFMASSKASVEDLIQIAVNEGMTSTDVYSMYFSFGMDMFSLFFYLVTLLKLRFRLPNYLKKLAIIRKDLDISSGK